MVCSKIALNFQYVAIFKAVKKNSSYEILIGISNFMLFSWSEWSEKRFAIVFCYIKLLEAPLVTIVSLP